MVCLGGIANNCGAGNADGCTFKTLNPDLYMPNVIAAYGYEGGFSVDWNYTQFPDLLVGLLYRVSETTPFLVSEIIVERSAGHISVEGLPSDIIYDLYVRTETDDSFSPWERYSVITHDELTVRSKVVQFGEYNLLFGSKNIIED